MTTSLADRDCSRPNGNILSRTSTFSNQASASRSLPRRRSVSSSLGSSSSQSLQLVTNPQLARKAAQAMLQRQRTSQMSPSHVVSAPDPFHATGQNDEPHPDSHPAPLSDKGQLPSLAVTPENQTHSVINVTVDEGGVRILGGKTPGGTPRTASRNKIGRASHRTRQDFRQRMQQPWIEDKENSSSGRSNNDDIANIPVRRQSVRDLKSGMSSIGGALSPANGRSNEWDGSMPRRHSSRSFINHAKPSVELKVVRDSDTKTQVDEKEAVTELPKPGADVDKGKDVKEHCPAPKKELGEVEEKEVGPVLDGSENLTNTVEAKMPNSGSWCDKCAGVGLIVAALLTDREKRDAGCDAVGDEADYGKKGGWRSVVLGESGRGKLERENARLMKENKGLFDMVVQLQRQLDDVRKA